MVDGEHGEEGQDGLLGCACVVGGVRADLVCLCRSLCLSVGVFEGGQKDFTESTLSEFYNE